MTSFPHSRRGQKRKKGVIGFVANDEDLAYGVPEPGEVDGLMAGLIPDCFMDPTAQPSRMTTGMLNDECFKIACCNSFWQSTRALRLFATETTKAAEQELKSIGINFQSEHLMVSGKTGVPFKVRIYIGVVQYLRLVHEAVDKVQNRYKGSYLPRTRQPITGIDQAGAQRLGEMELEAICAYGSMYSLQEYVTRMSDLHILITCAQCNEEIERTKRGSISLSYLWTNI